MQKRSNVIVSLVYGYVAQARMNLYLTSDNHRGGGHARGIHYRDREIAISGGWRVSQ